MRFFPAPAAFFIAGAMTVSSPVRAQSPIDGIEHIFGASNINGVAGNGRLSVGISHLGDLTVMSWPSPSYYDQMMHIGSNDLFVRDRAGILVYLTAMAIYNPERFDPHLGRLPEIEERGAKKGGCQTSGDAPSPLHLLWLLLVLGLCCRRRRPRGE